MYYDMYMYNRDKYWYLHVFIYYMYMYNRDKYWYLHVL